MSTDNHLPSDDNAGRKSIGESGDETGRRLIGWNRVAAFGIGSSAKWRRPMREERVADRHFDAKIEDVTEMQCSDEGRGKTGNRDGVTRRYVACLDVEDKKIKIDSLTKDVAEMRCDDHQGKAENRFGVSRRYAACFDVEDKKIKIDSLTKDVAEMRCCDRGQGEVGNRIGVPRRYAACFDVEDNKIKIDSLTNDVAEKQCCDDGRSKAGNRVGVTRRYAACFDVKDKKIDSLKAKESEIQVNVVPAQKGSEAMHFKTRFSGSKNCLKDVCSTDSCDLDNKLEALIESDHIFPDRQNIETPILKERVFVSDVDNTCYKENSSETEYHNLLNFLTKVNHSDDDSVFKAVPSFSTTSFESDDKNSEAAVSKVCLLENRDKDKASSGSLCFNSDIAEMRCDDGRAKARNRVGVTRRYAACFDVKDKNIKINSLTKDVTEMRCCDDGRGKAGNRVGVTRRYAACFDVKDKKIKINSLTKDVTEMRCCDDGQGKTGNRVGVTRRYAACFDVEDKKIKIDSWNAKESEIQVQGDCLEATHFKTRFSGSKNGLEDICSTDSCDLDRKLEALTESDHICPDGQNIDTPILKERVFVSDVDNTGYQANSLETGYHSDDDPVFKAVPSFSTTSFESDDKNSEAAGSKVSLLENRDKDEASSGSSSSDSEQEEKLTSCSKVKWSEGTYQLKDSTSCSSKWSGDEDRIMKARSWNDISSECEFNNIENAKWSEGDDNHSEEEATCTSELKWNNYASWSSMNADSEEFYPRCCQTSFDWNEDIDRDLYVEESQNSPIDSQFSAVIDTHIDVVHSNIDIIDSQNPDCSSWPVDVNIDIMDSQNPDCSGWPIDVNVDIIDSQNPDCSGWPVDVNIAEEVDAVGCYSVLPHTDPGVIPMNPFAAEWHQYLTPSFHPNWNNNNNNQGIVLDPELLRIDPEVKRSITGDICGVTYTMAGPDDSMDEWIPLNTEENEGTFVHHIVHHYVSPSNPPHTVAACPVIPAPPPPGNSWQINLPTEPIEVTDCTLRWHADPSSPAMEQPPMSVLEDTPYVVGKSSSSSSLAAYSVVSPIPSLLSAAAWSPYASNPSSVCLSATRSNVSPNSSTTTLLSLPDWPPQNQPLMLPCMQTWWQFLPFHPMKPSWQTERRFNEAGTFNYASIKIAGGYRQILEGLEIYLSKPLQEATSEIETFWQCCCFENLAPMEAALEINFPASLLDQLIGKNGENVKRLMGINPIRLIVLTHDFVNDVHPIVLSGFPPNLKSFFSAVKRTFPPSTHPKVNLSLMNHPYIIKTTHPLCMPVTLPNDGFTDACVINVVDPTDPSRVNVRLPQHPSYNQLHLLEACMRVCYNRNKFDPPIVEHRYAFPGAIVAIHFSGVWRRAEVVEWETEWRMKEVNVGAENRKSDEYEMSEGGEKMGIGKSEVSALLSKIIDLVCESEESSGKDIVEDVVMISNEMTDKKSGNSSDRSILNEVAEIIREMMDQVSEVSSERLIFDEVARVLNQIIEMVSGSNENSGVADILEKTFDKICRSNVRNGKTISYEVAEKLKDIIDEICGSDKAFDNFGADLAAVSNEMIDNIRGSKESRGYEVFEEVAEILGEIVGVVCSDHELSDKKGERDPVELSKDSYKSAETDSEIMKEKFLVLTGRVLVRFLDHGGRAWVVGNYLRQIRVDFLKLPDQAIECRLVKDQADRVAAALKTRRDVGNDSSVKPLDASWVWLSVGAPEFSPLQARGEGIDVDGTPLVRFCRKSVPEAGTTAPPSYWATNECESTARRVLEENFKVWDSDPPEMQNGLTAPLTNSPMPGSNYAVPAMDLKLVTSKSNVVSTASIDEITTPVNENTKSIEEMAAPIKEITVPTEEASALEENFATPDDDSDSDSDSYYSVSSSASYVSARSTASISMETAMAMSGNDDDSDEEDEADVGPPGGKKKRGGPRRKRKRRRRRKR